MKLEIILFPVSIMLLSVAILFDVNFLHYASPVPYDQWQKINFHDFRAFKKPGLTLDGMSEFAYIKTSRTVRCLPTGEIEIITFFHPSRSYVFAQDIRNPDLLRHELYHFHIAEYFSRLFRRELCAEASSINAAMIDRLKRKYNDLELEMQAQYDHDSYHSYVMQEQRNWELKVDSLLHSLEEFSRPIVSIKVKP